LTRLRPGKVGGVLDRIQRLWQRVENSFNRMRHRYGWFDHLARAVARFDEVGGGRLAAAVTYNAFLAVFPLLLLAFALLGYFLGRNATATAELSELIEPYLPTLDVSQFTESRYTAGIIGLVGVVYVGLTWVDTLRASIRLIWHRSETPGNPVLARVVDLGVLIAFGGLFGLSILVSFGLNFGVEWVLERAGARAGGLDLALNVAAFLVGVVVDIVLFIALLAGLPRLRMSLRRLFVPALIGAIGYEVLKTFSQIFLARTTTNPAYAVVAGAAALLIFLNLLNQLLLFCAALTATSKKGDVTERRAFALRRAELTDDAARRAPVDAPTPGAG
jgi:membrane protein